MKFDDRRSEWAEGCSIGALREHKIHRRDLEIAKHVLSDGAATVYIVEVP